MIHRLEHKQKWNRAITPQSTAAAQTSSYLDMTEYGAVAFHCMAAASSSDVACAVMQATDSSGTSAKACTNGPQSGVATLSGDGTNPQDDVIEICDRDLDVANSFTHAAIRMTPAGTTVIAASAVRGNCRHPQASMPS